MSHDKSFDVHFLGATMLSKLRQVKL